MYRPLAYTIKIWATAVLACPVLIALYFGLSGGGSGALYALLLCIPIGALFSLPSMLLLWLAVHLLREWDTENYAYQKLTLSSICIILSWLPFALFDRVFSVEFIYFVALYAAGTVAGVWIYSLHPKDSHAEEFVAE